MAELTATADLVGRAVDRALDRLFAVQRANGSWADFTSSSALATGVGLISFHLAGPDRYAGTLTRGCAWLRETQRGDGGWGDAVVDPSNLNSTTFALAALKLCDPERSEDAIRRGRAFVARNGGLAALKDRRRCSLSPIAMGWLALAGLIGWSDVLRLPVELVLLPRRVWQRVSFTMPAVLSLGLMHARVMPTSPPRRALVRLATPKALAYLRAAQGSNGGYQESPLLNGVVGAALTRAGAGADVAERSLAYLESTVRADGSWTCERDLEMSVTTYALEALDAAGRLDDPRLAATRSWILSCQLGEPFAATGSPAGAWTWGLPSGWPDTDDTAGALRALLRLGVPADDPQVRLGRAWLESMQNRDGSWGMFVKDSRVTIDQPCPALTGRVAMALRVLCGGPTPAIERALRFLADAQRPDGAVPSLWFRTPVYGTAMALDAHADLGRSDTPLADRARSWLLANQNADGSWGSEHGDPGTVEETGWALAGLLADGVATRSSADALRRGAAWLVARQREDGTWPQSVIGVYYLSLAYSSDHIANTSALRALALYRRSGLA